MTKTTTDELERALQIGDPDPERAEAAAKLFAERAAEEELVDVAYATVEAPIGELLVAATPRGVVKVSLPNHDAEEALEELSFVVSPRLLELPARLDDVRRQLDDYFEGRLRKFDLDLDWQPRGRRVSGPGPARDREDPLRRDPQLHRDGQGSGEPAGVPGRRHRLRDRTRFR